MVFEVKDTAKIYKFCAQYFRGLIKILKVGQVPYTYKGLFFLE